jgi:hypothetical protein
MEMKRHAVLSLASLALAANLCLAGGTADYSKELADFNAALDGFKNSGLPDLYKDVLSKGADALKALIESDDCLGITDAQIETASEQLSEMIGHLSASCEDIGAGGEEAAIDLDDTNREIAQKAHDADLAVKAAEAETDESIGDLIADAGGCSVKIEPFYSPHILSGGLDPISNDKFQIFDFVAVGSPPGGTYDWVLTKVSGETANGKDASQELKLVGRKSQNIFAGVHLEGKFGVEDGHYTIEVGVYYVPPDGSVEHGCGVSSFAYIESPKK